MVYCTKLAHPIGAKIEFLSYRSVSTTVVAIIIRYHPYFAYAGDSFVHYKIACGNRTAFHDKLILEVRFKKNPLFVELLLKNSFHNGNNYK